MLEQLHRFLAGYNDKDAEFAYNIEFLLRYIHFIRQNVNNNCKIFDFAVAELNMEQHTITNGSI